MTALTADLAHAPDDWLRATIEHLAMIVRADVYTGEPWEGAAIQDQASRDLDALLVELGRRQAAA